MHFCSLFSGEMYRTSGLRECLTNHGWANITEIENSPTKGGCWEGDLLNDERYTQLLASAAAGEYDVMFIAFPCSTFSVARFFPAVGPGDGGPPVVHNLTHKDGLPWDQIPANHHKELRVVNKLLGRATRLATTARNSPKHTTIIWESPARRSIPGTNQYYEDMPEHSTVFDTTPFGEMVKDTASISPWSSSTFAWCRFGSDAQKYATFWYTNDAARAFGTLNQPQYQCNHPAGTHKRRAGGRLDDGRWATEDFTAFPDELNRFIASGATLARTGNTDPLLHQAAAKQPIEVVAHGPPRRPNDAAPDMAVTGGAQASGAPSPGRPSPVSFGGFGSQPITSARPLHLSSPLNRAPLCMFPSESLGPRCLRTAARARCAPPCASSAPTRSCPLCPRRALPSPAPMPWAWRHTWLGSYTRSVRAPLAP